MPAYHSPSVESVIEAGALVLAGTGASSPTSEMANREPDDLGTQRTDRTQEGRGRHGPGEVTPPSSPAEHRNAGDIKPQDTNGQQDYSYRSPSPSGASAMTSSTSATHRSNGSNGSGSTITRRANPRRSSERARNGENRQIDNNAEGYDVETTPRPHQAPHFDADGGEPPYRPSRRSLDQPRGFRLGSLPNHKGPATKSVSSAGSSLNSDTFSEMSLVPSNEATMSSPDRSEPADSPNSRFFPHGGVCPPAPAPPQQPDPFAYMLPGMPYGGQPGPGQQSQPPPQQALTFYEHFPQPPRPGKLPATGYEQLASRLSVGETGGATIPPMYRRFESLNHRLLLHLQDELMQLEEELHQLDAADTQARRAHHGFHPASRRHEAMAANDPSSLSWHKTDILGKIGFKLNLYNQVLTSFKKTQDLPSPDFSDIDMYRSYLASHQPVVEAESRYLDMDDDLVSLCRPGFAHTGREYDEDLLTPMPRRAIAFPLTPTSPVSDVGSRSSAPRGRGRSIPQKKEKPSTSSDVPILAGAGAAAFLLPILSFIVIPGLLGRLAVVLLMSVATAIALLQTGLAQQNGPNGEKSAGSATNVIICAGVYGAVMAVVAAIV